MHNHLIVFSLLVSLLFSCKQTGVNRNTVEKDSSSVKTVLKKEKDSLIWKDSTVEIFVRHNRIVEGEEEIEIFTSDNKKLLKFSHDEGGYITFPFIIKRKEEIFIVFFEVWNGSGFLSKKYIYHYNSINQDLNTVKYDNVKEIIKKLKHKDSLYTRKGFFYNNFEFGKHCFDKNGDLPFSLILFNHNYPMKNHGLEGYKILKGKFSITNSKNKFIFKAENLELVTP